MARTTFLLYLAVSAALFGCSATVIEPGQYYQLDYVQTGGFEGVHQETTVDAASKKISFTGRNGTSTGELTGAELQHLTQVLNDADLEHAGGPYACGECDDNFTDDATLKLGGDRFEVQWDADESSPAELMALTTELNDLIEAKFPGSL